MKTILGLGNPGQRYQDTRHNIGVRVIEELARRRGLSIACSILDPQTHQRVGSYGDYSQEAKGSVRLLIPLVMMNESGKILNVVQANPQDLLLVYDDVNLPLGRLRLRAQGSSGGHHGMQDCLDALQTQQVARLRVGIGTENLPHDLVGFVLEPFQDSEQERVRQVIERAADACETWVKDGIRVAMDRYNNAPQVE